MGLLEINNSNKVSVIIPIYNVCKYIDHGIQQILCQSYKNFEIIIVDDGSTDGSYEKCKNLAAKDNRIKLFHQENQGAGSARNLGLNNAKGEFIYFYDIDDEISVTLLEYNVSVIKKKEVEMVVFGYQNVETTYNCHTSTKFPETEITNNAQLRDKFIEEFVLKVNGFIWNKFYKKSFLDKYQLRFENQRIQQDEIFNILCYKYIQRMYISSEVLYTYYIYNKGNTRSRFIADRFDIYKSVRMHFEDLKTFWKIKDKRLDDYLNNRFYNSVLGCINFNIFHPDCPWSNEEKKKEISRILHDPYTQESFVYANHKLNSIENRLYLMAIRKENLLAIKTIAYIFRILHQIRIKLK